jgi:hypothetical protein
MRPTSYAHPSQIRRIQQLKPGIPAIRLVALTYDEARSLIIELSKKRAGKGN